MKGIKLINTYMEALGLDQERLCLVSLEEWSKEHNVSFSKLYKSVVGLTSSFSQGILLQGIRIHLLSIHLLYVKPVNNKLYSLNTVY